MKYFLESFVNQDDTSIILSDTLYTLIEIRYAVNDRLLKVDRDLDVIRNMLVRDKERQGKAKQQKLANGATFFQKLCTFDS